MSSEDEVDELGAVLVSLVAEDANEDGEDEVVGDRGGVLDDLIGDQEHDADVLEAVGGQQEGDSGGFNGVSQLGLDLVDGSARLELGLQLPDQGDQLGLGSDVFLVLSGAGVTSLSWATLASIWGLVTASSSAMHLSFRKAFFTSSSEWAAALMTKRARTTTKRDLFIAAISL